MSDLIIKENPTLKDLQEYIYKRKVLKGHNVTDKALECMYLTEEVGELIAAVRRNMKGNQRDINKSEMSLVDIEEEVADVLIFLLGLANIHGIDVEKALRAKEEKNKNRVWTVVE